MPSDKAMTVNDREQVRAKVLNAMTLIDTGNGLQATQVLNEVLNDLAPWLD